MVVKVMGLLVLLVLVLLLLVLVVEAMVRLHVVCGDTGGNYASAVVISGSCAVAVVFTFVFLYGVLLIILSLPP